MVIVSAGIRPRDELAREAGLDVGERGGVVVDDGLCTSDPRIFAIGETALHRGSVYGLVAPGYEMADVLARRLTGETAAFEGADLSTKLKLLGVDVASFGDAFADDSQEACGASCTRTASAACIRSCWSRKRAIACSAASSWATRTPYMQLLGVSRGEGVVPANPHELLFGSGGAAADAALLADDALVCSCNDVRKGDIVGAIRDDALSTVGAVKTCTKAGTAAGAAWAWSRRSSRPSSRARVAWSIAISASTSPSRDRSSSPSSSWAGSRASTRCSRATAAGSGCEICRPAVASILASDLERT